MAQKLPLIVAMVLMVLAACGPAATPTSTPSPSPKATEVSGVLPTLTSTATPRPAVAPTPKPTPTTAPTESKPKYGGTLRSVVRGDPPMWDPYKITTALSQTRLQHSLVFSTVATITSPKTAEEMCTVKFEPDAAKSWEWKDDTTLQVNIRSGVLFHNKPPVNGRELTAYDAAYSLNKFLDVQRGGLLSRVVDSVSRIDALDRYTVVIKTNKPAPDLPFSFLANDYGSVVLAKEAGGPKESWDVPDSAYIGSGPFMFKKYLVGVKAAYERNPTYWKPGLPYVAEFEFLIVPDMSTRASLLRSGQLAVWNSELPYAVVQDLRRTSPEVASQQCPSRSGDMRLYFRTDRPPFDDIRVRRAAAMAIDQETLISTLALGAAHRSAVLPIGAHEYYLDLSDYPPEARRYLDYHPDEAKSLLREAGYSNGLDTTLTWTLGYGASYNFQTEAIVAMLNKVGIRAALTIKEYAAFTQTAMRGDYDHMTNNRVNEYNPALAFIKFDSTAGWVANRSHIRDNELDAWISRWFVTLDEGRRKELGKQIQVRVAEQAYVYTLPAVDDFAALQPWVQGVYLGGRPNQVSGPWAEQAWISK